MAEARPGRLRRLDGLHRRVVAQIDEILELVTDPEVAAGTVTPVSGWSILDHAEHLARADEASLHQLEAALDRDGGPRARLTGTLFLALGWIPRGLGKAPEATRPESVGRDATAEALRTVRGRIAALGDRLDTIHAAGGRASHPILGGFTPARWLRFLEVHHRHHLKIIRDIRDEIGP